MAYLFSRYPAVSHTFFLQEVDGLRRLGLHIETASINPPDRAPQQLSTEEAFEAEFTCYIKPRSRIGGFFTAAAACLRHPAVLARGLRAVAGLRGLSIPSRIQWLFYLAEAMLLGAWLRQRNLRHLHVHFGGPVAAVAMLASIAWKVPYSLTIHGPEELLDTSAYRLREKLAQAAFVLCISDFCRSQLMRITPPEQWPKLHIVRLGVSPALLGAARPAPSRGGCTRIVCTGRLVPEKAQRVLVEAVATLRAQGEDVVLDLIGDGPDRQGLQQQIELLGMRNFVRLLGAMPHRDTLEHVAAADIFALPSFAEGIPVALMEAMALGVPCVSTPVAGIPELIRHGQSGLLVAPGNVSELASALSLLCAQPELRARIARAAAERCAAEYNLTTNHQQLAALLTTEIASQGSAT